MNPNLFPCHNSEQYLVSVEVVQSQEQNYGGSIKDRIVSGKLSHDTANGDPRRE
jgi:hypothetical protein